MKSQWSKVEKSQRSKVEEDWLEATDLVRKMLDQMESAACMDHTVQMALLQYWVDLFTFISKLCKKP